MTLRRLLASLLLLGLVLSTTVTARALDKLDRLRLAEEELLYLPNGRHIKLMSLGHQALFADLFYIWAIQYYSNYERKDRYRYVEHVFGDVIGELDPYYVDPIWLGALILSVEANDLEAGLRLLDRGLTRNPTQWIFPYLAGWELYHRREFERAAVYFGRAASIPGAPPVTRRMRAGMFSKAGLLEDALRQWQEVIDDSASDETSRRVAGLQLRELALKRDLATLRDAVERFRNENARLPRSLEELHRRAYIQQVPLDPNQNPYRLDPRTGEVRSTAGRMLGGE